MVARPLCVDMYVYGHSSLRGTLKRHASFRCVCLVCNSGSSALMSRLAAHRAAAAVCDVCRRRAEAWG